MNNRDIPINKGNYSLDTVEREIIFEAYRAEGWEKEYKEYRKNWEEYPKNQFVSDYPLLVDIELSSVCNLKCPMCYTITDDFKNKVNATLMDYKLFIKIIDEIKDKVPAIRLSLRGEPMLHKQFIECISYAKNSGIKEVSFLTNGSKLDKEIFIKIMEAGADWITISIDGIDEMYESIRKPLKFSDTFQKVKDIKEIKNQYNRHRPVIKVQSVWPAIRANPSEYYNKFLQDSDLIAFNPLIDYLGNDEDIIYIDEFMCPQHYQRLVIGADGLAMMCSNDEENTVVVGNASSDSIHNIWHGEKLTSIRDTHKKENGFMNIPVCRKCYLPRKTMNEEVQVDNRSIIVKNYMNRIQEIGE